MRFSIAPLMVLLVFAVSAGVVWLAYGDAGDIISSREPPLVKASSQPLKRAPDDPGGSAVAELGGVGELLSDQPGEAEERLLPQPEQPGNPADQAATNDGSGERQQARAALEALVSEITSDGANAGGAGGPSPDDPIDSTTSVEAETSSALARSLERRAIAAGDATSVSADAASPAETDVAKAEPVFEATSNGRFRVQLAAVRAEADAQRAWALFEEKLGPFISGLQPFFERAETANGIFYRVQVGPFGASDEADRLCVELKKQNASCFVVTR